jgi:putative SOS response-associated peptidase YedK
VRAFYPDVHAAASRARLLGENAEGVRYPSPVCARYTSRKKTLREVADALEAEYAEDDEPLYRARFNVAPTDLAWIVELGGDRRVLRPATWNYWGVGPSSTSAARTWARAPAIARPSRRGDARSSRMASTSGRPRRATRRPTTIEPTTGSSCSAGSTSDRRVPTSTRVFTVLTTNPNALVARVHDRMPVVLPVDRIEEWLGGESAEAVGLIGPAPEDALVATAVSKRVNNVKNDDEECVAAEPEAGPAQVLGERAPHSLRESDRPGSAVR